MGDGECSHVIGCDIVPLVGLGLLLSVVHGSLDLPEILPLTCQVPTVGEMVEMWKKNHNLFAILYGWFLAKARF